MTQELRRLAEAANTTAEQRANMQTAQYHAAWLARDAFKNACTPAAILDLLDRLEKAEKDAARLEYVYSGKKTNSNDLVLIEMRFINDDIPTMDEVRTAIDAAMEASK